MLSVQRRKAFTLIELLVVVAIIALLLSIIVPSLQNAKRYASSAVCLANVSQLGKSWLLYGEDNDNKIVDGDTSDEFGGFQTQARNAAWGGPVRVHCWVGRPMGPNGDNLNDDVMGKIRGFEKGALWPYVNDPKAYNCPSDLRYIKRAKVPLNDKNSNPPGLWVGGYRTYSLGKPLSKRPTTTPTDSGDPSGEMTVEIQKTSQFVNASGKIVFLEETDGYGWNHRTWNMNLRSPQWIDPFAILHNDSSTFSFADAHAERHKWVDQQTRNMAEAEEKSWSAVDTRTGSTEDYQWFKSAYIPGRRPAGI